MRCPYGKPLPVTLPLAVALPDLHVLAKVVVEDPGHILLEMYAPWCPHCQVAPCVLLRPAACVLLRPAATEPYMIVSTTGISLSIPRWRGGQIDARRAALVGAAGGACLFRPSCKLF
jgi:hypothetical protein